MNNTQSLKPKLPKTKDRTKKKNHCQISQQEKAKLWNIFDKEIEHPDRINIPLECEFDITNSGEREICELCQTILAFSNEGFPTCTNPKCGTIYKDIVDSSPEWRYYGADDNQNSDPTRCGMPVNPLLEESSYGCKIMPSGKLTHEMRKIALYTLCQSMPYKEKAQYDDFQRITIYANNAGISKKIIDDAIKYHKKIKQYNKQSFRKANKDGLTAGSIYLACRSNGCPRTSKELATIFNLNISDASTGCKNAQSILNIIEEDMDCNEKTIFTETVPENFIERYCSKLNINAELTKLSMFIAIKIRTKGLLQENTPNSIAAGIVYFISQLCGLNVSKKEVNIISDSSEVTINKCCKKLEKMTAELVPQVILDKYRNPHIQIQTSH